MKSIKWNQKQNKADAQKKNNRKPIEINNIKFEKQKQKQKQIRKKQENLKGKYFMGGVFKTGQGVTDEVTQ